MATLTEKYEEGNNKKYFKSWTKNLTEWQAKVKLSAFNLYILFLWGCNKYEKQAVLWSDCEVFSQS